MLGEKSCEVIENQYGFAFSNPQEDSKIVCYERKLNTARFAVVKDGFLTDKQVSVVKGSLLMGKTIEECALAFKLSKNSLCKGYYFLI